MAYPCKIYAPPADEPVSLAEAKAQCQVEHSAEDDLISGYIVAARQDVENVTGRALVTQTWDVYLPWFPWCEIVLPFGNLQSIGVLEYTTAAGSVVAYTIDGTDIKRNGVTVAHIDTVSEPARIVLADGQVWPSDTLKSVNPIHVRMTCGYGGASAVPQAIKQAILLQVRHFYDHRSAVALGTTASVDSKPLAMGVEALLANYRLWG